MVERRRLVQGRRALQRGRRLSPQPTHAGALLRRRRGVLPMRRAPAPPVAVARRLRCSRPPRQASRDQESLVEDETRCSRPGRRPASGARRRRRARRRRGPRARRLGRDRSAPDGDAPPARLRPRRPGGLPRGALGRGSTTSSAARARAGSRAALPLDADPALGVALRRAAASRRRLCRPVAAALRRLRARARAALLRGYADENQGGGVLPRVPRWSFGNEPNQPSWLQPQFARSGGITYAAAAVRYRALAPAASPACAPAVTGATRCCSARRPDRPRDGPAAAPPDAAGDVHPRRCCASTAAAQRSRARPPRCAAAAARAGSRDAASRTTRTRSGGSQPPLTKGRARDGDHDRLVRPARAAARRRRRAAAGSRAGCRSTTPSTASRPTRPTACSASRWRSRPLHQPVRLHRLPRPPGAHRGAVQARRRPRDVELPVRAAAGRAASPSRPTPPIGCRSWSCARARRACASTARSGSRAATTAGRAPERPARQPGLPDRAGHPGRRAQRRVPGQHPAPRGPLAPALARARRVRGAVARGGPRAPMSRGLGAIDSPAAADPAGFYAHGYTAADPAEGERLGRWRALGARGKAAHVAALLRRGPACTRAPWSRSAAATARCSRRSRRAASGRCSTASSWRRRRRRWRAGAPLPGVRRVEAYDGAHVPAAGGAYDLAVLSHVVEHVPDPRAAAARGRAGRGARRRRGAAGGQPLGRPARQAGGGGADRAPARPRPRGDPRPVRGRRA